MEIERRLQPDLWKSICAHYERTDYTEPVRDAVLRQSIKLCYLHLLCYCQLVMKLKRPSMLHCDK